MITNPLVIVLLHIGILVGASLTFGIIFGPIMYILAVWMLSTGELT